MASSGTTAFNLNIDEVIDEAYERCGLSTASGYDLKRARRNLNIFNKLCTLEGFYSFL